MRDFASLPTSTFPWMEANTVGDRKRKRNILMVGGLVGDWAGKRPSSAFNGRQVGFWLVLPTVIF